MTFELIRLRFRFRAVEALYFPRNKAGNALRGALGTMLPTTIFAPQFAAGPSGLADPPRPFVFRAAHLNGQTIPPDAEFHFDIHVFDATGASCPPFVLSFAHLARQGFGHRRGHATLLSADQERIAIDLDAPAERVSRVRVQFVTPTELKSLDRTAVEFRVLFARLRDRISTLRALYGPGPLDIDFRAMGERAGRVRLAHSELTWHDSERRSSRTGQTHPLGGFTGLAEYHAEDDGDLSEFLPYLRAGQWTGVGRQTVWGKGEICLQLLS